ncbi:hypothetical protein [Streptomyces aidingensis]|uniref:Uncharacterized protein n=1 Tax=Streptomyces aidingensis TaxID=910347 RepID=A0A1I1PV90_9ACTN|nr:hypothetical protein [Streptomyces aidingensis]SFD13821.1 hypothetical protein SAMN05421773_11078 [Streptomyces aidingensis]
MSTQPVTPEPELPVPHAASPSGIRRRIATPPPGALAEQRHLLDEHDTAFASLAPGHPNGGTR